MKKIASLILALFSLIGTWMFRPQIVFAIQDWPMFRKDSIHTGFSSEETSLTPSLELLWKSAAIGAPNSPTVYDGKVFVEFAGTLYAYNAKTGALLWSKPTQLSDHASVAAGNGMVFDGSGIHPSCSNCGIVAHNPDTGDEVWRLNISPKGARQPNFTDGVLYFGSDDWFVRAVAANTGNLLWTSPKLNEGIVAVPAVANGKVIVGTWGGRLYALDASDGTIIWQFSTVGVTFSSPSIMDGTVYVGSGIENVYAIDLETGSEKWRYTGGTDSVWGSPAIAYGNLYIQDLAGRIHALDLETGSQVWFYQTGAQPSSSYSSPAVANGVVYVGSQDKKIYALDALTGEVLWNYETGNPIKGSPAISDGILYIASNDGHLYAFGNEPVEPPEPPGPNRALTIPGMGASWNNDAILNCTTNDDYDPSEWSLASFAEDVYNPLLSALDNAGRTHLEFYYDWRRNIPVNSPLLGQFIENNTEAGEKVDLLGHSMGGLVARDYVSEENENNKAAKLLTIGSPHRGTPLAYPAWAGGQVWESNLIKKIAVSLLLKRCGGLFSNDRETIQTQIPSVQDLLPTENYLMEGRTNIIISLEDMVTRNNWLENNEIGNTDTIIETLSGFGHNTVEFIKVRERNRRDAALDNWVDGKAVSRVNTTEGDGTVLLFNSQLDQAENNRVINQTHYGIINSDEGIGEIFDFLGITSPQTIIPGVEPASAFVIIGNRASLVVTDPALLKKNSKDGVVSFINPKNGNYLLLVKPEANDSEVIIGQFLANGEYLWKEYKLKGKTPKIFPFSFQGNALNQNPL